MGVKYQPRGTMPTASGMGKKPFIGTRASRAEREKKVEAVIEEVKAKGELVPAADIDARRNQTWELYLRGVPPSVIALTYQVSEQTVRNDLQHVTDKLGMSLMKIGPVGIVARAYYRYEELKAQAAMLLANMDDKSGLGDKVAVLYLLKNLEDSQLRMIQNVGALPKPSRMALRDEAHDEADKEFTPDDAREVIGEIISVMRNARGTYEQAEEPARED